MRLSARLRAIPLVAALAVPSVAKAEVCPGAPFINVLRPRTIEESAGTIVGPQIFGIAPHPRGTVLFANNNGLIAYDGATPRVTPVGKSGVAFSVATAADGRIFVGGSHTFGEMIQEPDGTLIYQPFEADLQGDDRHFSDVWQVFVSAKNRVFFRSPERVFILQDGDVLVVAPAGRFTAAVLEGETLYVHDTAAGLVSVNAGTRPMVIAPALRSVPVTALAMESETALLVGTQDRRVLRYDFVASQTTPIGQGVQEIQTSEILSLKKMEDGSLAVGTLRNGLVILDSAGKPVARMNADTGLPDSAVLALASAHGSLWAGTSGGVAQIQTPGPLQTFGTREGLPGIVESLVRHDGVLFAATSHGLHRMTCGARAFEAVPALQKQTFRLLSAGSLLVAAADGIYEVERGAVRLIRPGLARSFVRSRDGAHVWAATQDGVVAFANNRHGWFEVGALRFEGGPEVGERQGVEATSLGEDTDGRLWLALADGSVISGSPAVDPQNPRLTNARLIDEKAGLTGSFAEILELRDGVRIGTSNAVLKPAGGRVAPDPLFVGALGEGASAFRLRDAGGGGYWIASAKRPLRLSSDSGSLRVQPTSLARSWAGSRILDFLEAEDGSVWIGADDGAVRYDPARDSLARTPIAALIRRMESHGLELFRGGIATEVERPLPHLASVRFEVASTSLDDPSRSRYRFRLDGQDADWSPWVAEFRKDYTNLGPGDYRFRVETRDVYGRVGSEAHLSFVVLTPWYRKPAALALGALALAGIFFIALRVRTHALERRQKELQAVVDQKTAELREASFTDPLTGLRNRRYFAEIIEAEASLACRPGSPALHLFLVDLDHFKQVNDTYGHSAGDSVLKQTAARLKTAMRTSDLLFRWGGEEFLIVARGAPDLPRHEIANRIVRTIGRDPFDIGTGASLAKTCSVGFASFPFYADTPQTVPFDAVMELADLSLYRAKQTGRNRAVGVSPQAGAHVETDAWKGQVLDNLEKAAVSIEVLEGPSAGS